jgi:ribosomal protein S12 methylthiotransferase accessory factor
VFSRAVNRRPGTAGNRVRFAITAVAALIGLVPPDAGSIWTDLRVGEIKTIRPLAAGDSDAHREDCKGVGQFAQLQPDHRRTYRSIETLLEMEDPDAHEAALVGLYGDETLDRATDLIDGDLRFFGLQSPGPNLEGCAMHQCLLKQYEKAHPVAVDARK